MKYCVFIGYWSLWNIIEFSNFQIVNITTGFNNKIKPLLSMRDDLVLALQEVPVPSARL